MLKRVQLDHTHLWRAMFKSPLILLYFIAPFLAGILVSPTFANYVNTPEWLGVIGFALFIAAIIYANGFLGALLFGAFLYYFLNAIRFQNRWLYWLAGFASGTVFNLLYPWYSKFLDSTKDFSALQNQPLAEIVIHSYPVVFGMAGAAVAWGFWRELSKGGEINADRN